MSEVFLAGVEPGGLTTDHEIKILLCHILCELGRPVPVSLLIEVFVERGVGNYFETASAAAALVQSGQLRIVDAPLHGSRDEPDAEGTAREKCYEVTPLGVSTNDTLSRNLPSAVREHTVEAARRALLKRERRAQNHASTEKIDGGYRLTLGISDVGSDLLTLSILLPDLDLCEQLKARFFDDPIVIYKGVVALLTGSYDSVGALLDDAGKPSV